MILDERTEFADATSVILAAGTAVLGDVIDTQGLGGDGSKLGNARDLGVAGDDLWLVIQTDTEVITGGSAGTIQFFLVSDALATLGAGVVASCTEHWRSPALVTDDSAANDAKLNAGGVIACVQLPAGVLYERYLGILFTTATADTTAGKVNAFLTHDPSLWRAYADAAQ